MDPVADGWTIATTVATVGATIIAFLAERRARSAETAKRPQGRTKRRRRKR